MNNLKRKRVVITGVGVCAPGKPGKEAFWQLLESNCSAIDFQPEMKEAGFACHIGGLPKVNEEEYSEFLEPSLIHNGFSFSLLYAAMSAAECWKDAGMPTPSRDVFHQETGCIFGCGTHGIDELRRAINKVDEGKGRRLRSSTVFQTMNSGSAAYISGKYGLGGYVSSNSSACATGTESLLLASERIAYGRETAMIAGSTSEGGIYVWGGFDAMRILPRNFNDRPGEGSRPMDKSSQGFVPSAGAACFYLESLESALRRQAPVYAEILGGYSNCGGQRNGGSMTAVNSEAARRCVRGAILDSDIEPHEIDTVNGHLTGTDFDALEIHNWLKALGGSRREPIYINSFKGHIGHALAAAGSLEIAGILGQFSRKRIFGNSNLHELKPELQDIRENINIPLSTLDVVPRIVAKASFGFGDVNSCVIMKSFQTDEQ